MSITLNNNDFQCLQDQLVDLKAKNYELAEKYRRSQADFEAAKAKICSLQLKLEEQEHDFQVTSTTLRREIEVATKQNNTVDSTNDESESSNNSKEDDYKTKYKKLLHKAKELQQRYENSLAVIQQMDEKLKAPNECTKHIEEIDALKTERDNLQKEVETLRNELKVSNSRIESLAEERRIQDKKGSQLMKELKRQLASEKNRNDELQKRLEDLQSQESTTTTTVAAAATNVPDLSSSSSSSGDLEDKSMTLNDSDFQCLQDQLVELKAKNYELAETSRRNLADFEAAKAKIFFLQYKLEEQERDFQITSSILRREIEAATRNKA